MGPIASLLSRLLASRLGSAASKAASSMRGTGGLDKLATHKPDEVAKSMADTLGTRGFPPQSAPSKSPDSSGMLNRTVRHVVTFVGGLMGKMPEEDRKETRTQPQSTPQASAIRSRFGDILSGRTTLQAATQEQRDNQSAKANDQTGQSSGSGLGTAALSLAMKHPVAAAGLLAGALASVAVGAKRLGEAQAEGLKYLRAYNGQISAAYGRMARSDILRTRQQANATAGSTSALVDAVAEMRDAWAPVENVVTNIKNSIGTFGLKLFKEIGDGLSVLVSIGEKVGIIAKAADNPKAGPWQNTLNALADQYRQRNAPPPRQAAPAPPPGGKRK